MYLLDTNVLSEIRKIGKGNANEGVLSWANVANASQFYISVITLLEIQHGILRIKRKDTTQANHVNTWFTNDVIPTFKDRTLPINSDIALMCASLHVPDKRPANDALIASTAIVHGLTLVTRNEADFVTMPVTILNPFD